MFHHFEQNITTIMNLKQNKLVRLIEVISIKKQKSSLLLINVKQILINALISNLS